MHFVVDEEYVQVYMRNEAEQYTLSDLNAVGNETFVSCKQDGYGLFLNPATHPNFLCQICNRYLCSRC